MKERLNQLKQQQAEALKLAAFGGMTPAELQAYDKRRDEILRLSRKRMAVEWATGPVVDDDSPLTRVPQTCEGATRSSAQALDTSSDIDS